MRQISGKACLAAMVIAFGCIWSGTASAMVGYVVDDQLILSGQVVDGDAEQVAKALASSSAITTVILRNSPGGDRGVRFLLLGLRAHLSRRAPPPVHRRLCAGIHQCRISRILSGLAAR